MKTIIDSTLYLIAVINPVSKIFILSILAKQTDRRELRNISIKAAAIALGILLAFTLLGNFILGRIFHVQLYSFKVAGGVVLAYIGFKALTKGVFFETDVKQKLADLSIVPLASPMIAGPATITAAVSFAAEHGVATTAASLVAAVGIILIIMLLSGVIAKPLLKYNLMGALIRITGLIVVTMAVQMVFTGISDWLTGIQ